jgi:hypothetical protein
MRRRKAKEALELAAKRRKAEGKLPHTKSRLKRGL